MLCSNLARFLLKKDRKGRLSFKALQDASTIELLTKEAPHLLETDSVLVNNEGRWLAKSEAALAISKTIGFPYNVIFIGKIFPLSIRNKIYDYVAKNRYHWFGRVDKCDLELFTARDPK